jgi:hypothetical protein
MRFRLAGGLDLATGALLLGGALLVAAAIVAAAVTLSPPQPAAPPEVSAPAPSPESQRPASALSADRVATVIGLDAVAAAGGATRAGDHVDLLGYFPKASSGESVTRVLVEDVPILAVDRSGGGVALTLALPQDSALLLHEAQALGAKPFVALRPVDQAAGSIAPATFSDSDLARRLAGQR